MVDTTGWTVRNKLNEYFAKQNHVRLAKNKATKALIDAGVADAFAVLGFSPELVFDFEDEYYRTSGVVSTFSDSLTATRSSNATMVDSDGLLKWAPHNLVLNSATPATQSITVVSGAAYTVECTGVSIALSGAGSGTVTEGNPVTITASTTTLTLTVTGSTGTMWAYRSDLGGMVNNPDTGNSYVPTTSAARYLPRRGHHVYNGSAWVNEGMLHESEARTNLITYSNTFTDASWTKNSASVVIGQAAPDGTSNAFSLIEDATTNYHEVYTAPSPAATTHTASVYAKQGVGSRHLQLRPVNEGFGVAYANFDLANGVVGTTGGTAFVAATIEDAGSGWYRCSLSLTYTLSGAGVGLNLVTSPSAVERESYAGDNTSSILIYGAQLEAGSVPSSYIPTAGATATRAAETLTVAAADLPYSATAMSGAISRLLRYADTGSATEQTLFDWRADANNRITVTLDTAGANTGKVTLTVVSGGSAVSVTSANEVAPGLAVSARVAWRVTASEINISLNGTAATAVSNTAGVPDLSAADAVIGSMGISVQERMWAADLGDTGIAEASA